MSKANAFKLLRGNFGRIQKICLLAKPYSEWSVLCLKASRLPKSQEKTYGCCFCCLILWVVSNTLLVVSMSELMNGWVKSRWTYATLSDATRIERIRFLFKWPNTQFWIRFSWSTLEIQRSLTREVNVCRINYSNVTKTEASLYNCLFIHPNPSRGGIPQVFLGGCISELEILTLISDKNVLIFSIIVQTAKIYAISKRYTLSQAKMSKI